MTIQHILSSISDSKDKTREMIDVFTQRTMDSKWISSNFKELRIRYPNSYIAVRDQKVILSNKNLTELLALLMKKYGDIIGITIEHITDKPISLLL